MINILYMITLQSENNNLETHNSEFHKLNNQWNLWAHLPHDTDWGINSYKKIYTLKTIEETIAISETLPEILVKNCMLFIMKVGILPTWEDPKNRNGGCFSYKISNKIVYEVWKNLTYILLGETLSNSESCMSSITGITISPKKNFCIIKIWLSNCLNQNPDIIVNDVKGIISQGCLFKKHLPEY